MADETETPTEEQDPAEEAALKRLEEQGDELGAMKLRMERSERALARERGARQRIEAGTYKDALVKEFDLPDGDLISGKTKPEMRASAEKMAKLIAAAIEKKGLTAAATSAERKPGAEDFGSPPPVSSEAVSGDVPMEFTALTKHAQNGTMTRRQIIDDLRQHGGRPIIRKTIAGAARQRVAAEAAKTA
jgi:hypothetical protein